MSDAILVGGPRLGLNDGRTMPQLGLGLMRFGDLGETGAVVRRGFEAGFRLFDTASAYGNEVETGEALRALPGERDEIFVTTKLWNADHAEGRAAAALDASLARLGLDQVDLYLIHWPLPMHDRYVEAWRALIELRAAGKVRSIGVSNFTVAHLERIIGETGVVPAVNQLELHPFYQQAEMRAFHAAHGIVTQAWSPFGGGHRVGETLGHPTITAIAARHRCTPAQAVLAWQMALGIASIPKATGAARLAENLAALAVSLDEADMAAMAALHRGDGHCGMLPDEMALLSLG